MGTGSTARSSGPAYGAAGLGLLVAVISLIGGSTTVVGVGTIAVGGVAVALMSARASGFHSRRRAAWVLFALGVGLCVVGDLQRLVWPSLFDIDEPRVGPADTMYLVAYPVFAAAILLLPRRHESGYHRVGSILDLIISTAAVAIVAWPLVLRGSWRVNADGSTTELLVGLAYPLANLLVVALLATIVARRFSGPGSVLWFLGLALVLALGAQVLWLTTSWDGRTATLGWAEASWVLAYGAFGVAATRRHPDGGPSDPREAALIDRVLGLVPYGVAIGLLGFIALSAGGRIDVDSPAIIAALVVIAAAIGRLWVTIQEDHATLTTERDQLISVLSHELRTPLTGVLGFLDVLLDEWDGLEDGERRETAAIAREQGDQVHRIVTDLVTVARQRSHQLEVTATPFPIQSVIREAIHAALGPHHTEELAITCDGSHEVTGDRQRLVQVFANVLANAQKYGAGRILIECRPADRGVFVDIHDNGPGIPDKHLRVVWEPFERGSHQLDSTVPGSGLGLAIVRSIVEAHGGTASYQRSPALGGAWFRVVIPTRPSAPNGSPPSRPLR